MKLFLILLYPMLLILCFSVLLSYKPIRECVFRHKKKILFFLLVNLVLINVVLFLHLRQEQFIPYWDFGGFYRKTVEFVTMLSRSGKEAWDNLIFSMNFSEYSYLPECFLALPAILLGNSFTRFVIAMFNVFIIPANLVLFVLMLMISESIRKHQRLIQACGAAIIVLFAGNLYSLVLGYIGSAGLVWIASIMLLVYAGVLKKKNIGYNLFIGFSLLLIVLLRRWFAYWVVGFFVSFILAELLSQLKDKKWDLATWKALIWNLFFCGILPLICMLTFFFPLFKTFTTYDYAKAYSVVKVDGFWGILRWFIQYYGLFYIGLMIFGFYSGLRKDTQRELSLVCFFQILIACVLFNQVQNMGSHHYYIINIPAMLLILLGVMNMLALAQQQMILTFGVFFLLFQSVSYSKTLVFSNSTQVYQFINHYNWVFSAPLPDLRIRTDNREIQELANYLDTTPQEYEYVYTLSNSVIFNDDMLRNANLPYQLEGVKNQLSAKAYDYRDGVPTSFFQYYYIVVADPIQLQFGEEGQRCVSVLAQAMLHDEELKSYYQVEKKMKIDGDVNLFVYRRIGQVPNSVRQRISDEYKKFYPEDPWLYSFEMLPE